MFSEVYLVNVVKENQEENLIQQKNKITYNVANIKYDLMELDTLTGNYFIKITKRR